MESRSCIEESQSRKIIVLGICAMEKKSKSKPMQEILNRLNAHNEFQIIVFEDHLIANSEPEDWPVCDALITFSSSDFPTEKAIRYCDLRKPFLINNLKQERLLDNRLSVYNTLKSIGVPVPPHFVVDRSADLASSSSSPNGIVDDGLIESDDYIELNGCRLYKPFVEKPIDGNQHDICVYLPPSQGGGCRTLFRKTATECSAFVPDGNRIRRNGSFLYEQFFQVKDSADVKCYAVGPNYAHAEKRKSPCVDGIVQRDAHGKELRIFTSLSREEKDIAAKIVDAFQQTVCGFDLLRIPLTTEEKAAQVHGSLDQAHDFRTVVCDVNGWSFVKGCPSYYDQCAQILRDILLQKI